MRRMLILALLLGMLLPTASFAGIYGKIKGKVVDDKGKGLIGATVMVVGTTRGTSVQTTDGSFTIININAGTYEVKVSFVGMTAKTIAQVVVSADETTDLEAITLSDDVKTTEAIYVKAKALQSKKTIGSKHTISQEEMQDRAGGGTITGVLNSKVGVSAGSGGVSIRGSRSSQTQIRVDGLDVGNQFTGGFGSAGSSYPIVSSYATQEVQVLTGNFSAEYGDAMGGIVNTVVRTGRTDKYEGLFAYKADFDPLFGKQDYSLGVVYDGNKPEIKRKGDGLQLNSSDRMTFDFNFSGPLPFLDNSTFMVATNYVTRKQSAGYDVYDALGLNLNDIPGSGFWQRNVTGRMKFALTKELKLIVGGQYGITSGQGQSWGWYYADRLGVTWDTLSDGKIKIGNNGVKESFAKSNVGDNLITQMMFRINHTLSTTSFYELTVSWAQNNDYSGRRANFNDPSIVTGYDYIIPQDNYVITNQGTTIEQGGRDNIIDHWTTLSKVQETTDGYMLLDIRTPNPLTGYLEGSADYSSTSNPLGLENTFVETASSGYSLREGPYYQVDGNFTKELKFDEIENSIKTGFEVRFYETHKNQNGNPYDASPFYDVYTDRWGGNNYTANEEIREISNKPFKPFRFSYFIQDQIDYKGLTFTPGVRMDYFNANEDHRMLDASERFIGINEREFFASTDAKWQVSPRINVVYPITDRSNINIAYGIFFKMPMINYLYDYQNAYLERGNIIIGDPDMEAQRTNQYQIQYSNQLTDELVFTATTYYKDQYNISGIVYVEAVPAPYRKYATSEYGYARGIEFDLRKIAADNYSIDLNYTYASVYSTAAGVGSNSNLPEDPYTGEIMFPQSPYKLGTRAHSVKLNAGLFLMDEEGPEIFGVQPFENARLNFTFNYSSGYPYTKVDIAGNPVSEINSEIGPDYWNLTLRAQKEFKLADWFGESVGSSSINFYLDVYNVLNRTVVDAVYPVTGDPDDDGRQLNRQVGDYSAVVYYRDVDYGNESTFSTSQYDNLGGRKYSAQADHDGNGTVDQREKYDSYLKYIDMAVQTRGNYMTPRTSYFGVIVRF